MTSKWVKVDAISTLFGIAIGIVSCSFIFGWRQRQEKKRKADSLISPIEHDESLHWNPLDERRGLCDLVVKVNHIAITVSDVGKSLGFYVDILGLQQIRRPDFDRYGAWLTMGNIQLHLIKGIPVISAVDNLQVGHIALETSSVGDVLRKLRELNVDVRQNLSVTNAHKEQSKGKGTGTPVITQCFFNDPDGYFWELCNCEVLTEFSFGKKETIKDIDYNEGINHHKVFIVAKTASHWLGTKPKYTDEEFDDIFENKPRAIEINETMYANLSKRRLIYGDIMQGFTDEDIKEALLEANNFVPLTMEILSRRHGANKFYQPPAFLENGELVKPGSFYHKSK